MDMNDLDLYDDLDEFHEEEQKKSNELLAWENKYNDSLKTVDAFKVNNKELKKKIRTLEVNFQNLLDTAKAEIKRKDQQILQLTKEKDDICFRRKFPKHWQTTATSQPAALQQQVNIANPFKQQRPAVPASETCTDANSTKSQFDANAENTTAIESKIENRSRTRKRSHSRDNNSESKRSDDYKRDYRYKNHNRNHASDNLEEDSSYFKGYKTHPRDHTHKSHSKQKSAYTDEKPSSSQSLQRSHARHIYNQNKEFSDISEDELSDAKSRSRKCTSRNVVNSDEEHDSPSFNKRCRSRNRRDKYNIVYTKKNSSTYSSEEESSYTKKHNRSDRSQNKSARKNALPIKKRDTNDYKLKTDLIKQHKIDSPNPSKNESTYDKEKQKRSPKKCFKELTKSNRSTNKISNKNKRSTSVETNFLVDNLTANQNQKEKQCNDETEVFKTFNIEDNTKAAIEQKPDVEILLLTNEKVSNSEECHLESIKPSPVANISSNKVTAEISNFTMSNVFNTSRCNADADKNFGAIFSNAESIDNNYESPTSTTITTAPETSTTKIVANEKSKINTKNAGKRQLSQQALMPAMKVDETLVKVRTFESVKDVRETMPNILNKTERNHLAMKDLVLDAAINVSKSAANIQSIDDNKQQTQKGLFVVSSEVIEIADDSDAYSTDENEKLLPQNAAEEFDENIKNIVENVIEHDTQDNAEDIMELIVTDDEESVASLLPQTPITKAKKEIIEIIENIRLPNNYELCVNTNKFDDFNFTKESDRELKNICDKPKLVKEKNTNETLKIYNDTIDITDDDEDNDTAIDEADIFDDIVLGKMTASFKNTQGNNESRINIKKSVENVSSSVVNEDELDLQSASSTSAVLATQFVLEELKETVDITNAALVCIDIDDESQVYDEDGANEVGTVLLDKVNEESDKALWTELSNDETNKSAELRQKNSKNSCQLEGTSDKSKIQVSTENEEKEVALVYKSNRNIADTADYTVIVINAEVECDENQKNCDNDVEEINDLTDSTEIRQSVVSDEKSDLLIGNNANGNILNSQTIQMIPTTAENADSTVEVLLSNDELKDSIDAETKEPKLIAKTSSEHLNPTAQTTENFRKLRISAETATTASVSLNVFGRSTNIMQVVSPNCDAKKAERQTKLPLDESQETISTKAEVGVCIDFVKICEENFYVQTETSNECEENDAANCTEDGDIFDDIELGKLNKMAGQPLFSEKLESSNQIAKPLGNTDQITEVTQEASSLKVVKVVRITELPETNKQKDNCLNIITVESTKGIESTSKAVVCIEITDDSDVSDYENSSVKAKNTADCKTNQLAHTALADAMIVGEVVHKQSTLVTLKNSEQDSEAITAPEKSEATIGLHKDSECQNDLAVSSAIVSEQFPNFMASNKNVPPIKQHEDISEKNDLKLTTFPRKSLLKQSEAVAIIQEVVDIINKTDFSDFQECSSKPKILNDEPHIEELKLNADKKTGRSSFTKDVQKKYSSKTIDLHSAQSEAETKLNDVNKSITDSELASSIIKIKVPIKNSTENKKYDCSSTMSEVEGVDNYWTVLNKELAPKMSNVEVTVEAETEIVKLDFDEKQVKGFEIDLKQKLKTSTNDQLNNELFEVNLENSKPAYSYASQFSETNKLLAAEQNDCDVTAITDSQEIIDFLKKSIPTTTHSNTPLCSTRVSTDSDELNASLEIAIIQLRQLDNSLEERRKLLANNERQTNEDEDAVSFLSNMSLSRNSSVNLTEAISSSKTPKLDVTKSTKPQRKRKLSGSQTLNPTMASKTSEKTPTDLKSAKKESDLSSKMFLKNEKNTIETLSPSKEKSTTQIDAVLNKTLVRESKRAESYQNIIEITTNTVSELKSSKIVDEVNKSLNQLSEPEKVNPQLIIVEACKNKLESATNPRDKPQISVKKCDSEMLFDTGKHLLKNYKIPKVNKMIATSNDEKKLLIVPEDSVKKRKQKPQELLQKVVTKPIKLTVQNKKLNKSASTSPNTKLTIPKVKTKNKVRRILDTSSDEEISVPTKFLEDKKAIQTKTVTKVSMISPKSSPPLQQQNKRKRSKVSPHSNERNLTSKSLKKSKLHNITKPVEHAIFQADRTDICNQDDAAAMLPLMPVNTSQDAQFNDIDTHLQSMFHSPPHKCQEESPLCEAQQLASDMLMSITDTAETTTTNVTIDETANESGGDGLLNDSFETKRLSLGTRDYRFEKVSENVVNLFITRRRNKKKLKTMPTVRTTSPPPPETAVQI